MSESTPRHSVSVAAAVVDEDRVLVVKRRDSGAWEPPGGVLELNETITDGLRREVHEETGLDVEPVRLTGVYKNMTRGIVALVFRCRRTGGTLTTSQETSDSRWLDRGTLEQLVRDGMMTEVFAVRLTDALDDGQVPVRTHDGIRLLSRDLCQP